MTTPQPARAPERVVIEGRYVRLEPLAARHAPDLYRAASGAEGGAEGERRFTYLFEYAPQSEAAMADYVATAAAKADPLLWAVIDRASGVAEGRQALMRITPEHGVIEIGAIYWGPRLARTRAATEALYLHAAYAFDTLGYRRFEWKCHDANAASKAAARRFGFSFEGVFRQHMIIKGANRDTAWFALLDRDWPARRAEFERWLDPANFDAAGQQLTPLRFAPA